MTQPPDGSSRDPVDPDARREPEVPAAADVPDGAAQADGAPVWPSTPTHAPPTPTPAPPTGPPDAGTVPPPPPPPPSAADAPADAGPPPPPEGHPGPSPDPIAAGAPMPPPLPPEVAEPEPRSPTKVLVGGLLGLGLVLLVAALVTGSIVPDAGLGEVRTASVAALADAGCTEVPTGDLSDRDHLDPATAPPAAELYDVPLPAGGRHYGTVSPLVDGLPAEPLDVRALLHNMEHGSVVVWVDDTRLDARDLSTVEGWREQLGAAGFDNDRTGASVFVSRMPEGVDVGAGVALRAWGVAMDCPGWDLAAADAFVAQHYGSRGAAPEAELGPYPTDNGVLRGPAGLDEEGDTATV